MKCPICSERLLPGTDRCAACGYRILRQTPERPSVTQPNRPARPRRRLGCCVLVLFLPLILGLLSAVFSLTGHVSVDISTEDFGITIYEDIPAEAPAPEDPIYDHTPHSESRPAAADERCFAIEDGILSFDTDAWDGSPILTIPESVNGETVTAIGPGCFRDCSELTTIVLPDTITRICDEAFQGCAKLRGLYLPFGTESIGEDAFAGCADLEAICIPAAVTEIAAGCFDDCASLHYIVYEGSFEQWESLYNDYITPFTAAICLDGTFFHGTGR